MLRKDLRRNAAVSGTADPAEIARFTALAEEWWKPDGAFKAAHDFNGARVAHLAARLPALMARDPGALRPLQGLRMIDVGCGAGLATEPLSRLGADTLGIDATERNVRVATHHAAASGAPVRYRHALPEEVVAEGLVFDIVMCLEVVEHVADLPAFLAALARLTAPGGILAIATLNRTLRSFAVAIVAAEYLFHMMPRGTHSWRKFVTPAELAASLAPHGLRSVERTGMNFHPLTRRWSIGGGDGVAYIQFHRKVA